MATVSKNGIIGGFAGGIALGLALISLPATKEPEANNSITQDAPERLRAEAAAPSLHTPLEVEQLEELFDGLSYLLQDDYRNAAPILGKYAQLGESNAQSAIGAMYYFGLGLPLDRVEGIRWLRLASAQGQPAANESLAAAMKGTWQWESSDDQPTYARRPPRSAPDYTAPRYVTEGESYRSSRAAADNPSAYRAPTGPSLGARGSVDDAYGSGSASRRYIDSQSSGGSIISPPVILNRAGPGTYSDGSGDTYVQAGPQGVVNTRTGEFSPTN